MAFSNSSLLIAKFLKLRILCFSNSAMPERPAVSSCSDNALFSFPIAFRVITAAAAAASNASFCFSSSLRTFSCAAASLLASSASLEASSAASLVDPPKASIACLVISMTLARIPRSAFSARSLKESFVSSSAFCVASKDLNVDLSITIAATLTLSNAAWATPPTSAKEPATGSKIMEIRLSIPVPTCFTVPINPSKTNITEFLTTSATLVKLFIRNSMAIMVPAIAAPIAMNLITRSVVAAAVFAMTARFARWTISHALKLMIVCIRALPNWISNNRIKIRI